MNLGLRALRTQPGEPLLLRTVHRMTIGEPSVVPNGFVEQFEAIALRSLERKRFLERRPAG
eukprot:886427-Pyramimonas_sp.AAC.1